MRPPSTSRASTTTPGRSIPKMSRSSGPPKPDSPLGVATPNARSRSRVKRSSSPPVILPNAAAPSGHSAKASPRRAASTKRSPRTPEPSRCSPAKAVSCPSSSPPGRARSELQASRISQQTASGRRRSLSDVGAVRSGRPAKTNLTFGQCALFERATKDVTDQPYCHMTAMDDTPLVDDRKLGLGLALAGALAVVISDFLPLYSSTARIAENSAVQQGGWLYLVGAAIVVTAVLRPRTGRRLLLWPLGTAVLMVIGAIYFGLVDEGARTLSAIGPDGQPIPGTEETAAPGVGAYAMVVSTLALAAGAFILRNAR